jgi:hypothetical protein
MVDIGHPAHVHFFKNFVHEMEKRGHEFLVTARDKDVALQLLKAYGIEHTVVGRIGKTKVGLISEWVRRDWKIYSIAKKFRPDVLTGIHNPCMAHVARLIGAKSIIFTETEHATIANLVTFPFSDVVCTPSCFKKDLGKKQLRYNGYHEIAYLHPKYFKPDDSVLDELGLDENDRFTVIRFVSWGASHDIGQTGIDLATKRKLVEEIRKHGRIFITSESPLPEEFEKYRIVLSPEKLHDLLHYASLCIGEGGATATEAAILGTPSVLVATWAQHCGTYDDLSAGHDLISTFSDPIPAFARALELIRDLDTKKRWQEKRDNMLAGKIDVTEFMVNLVEQYSKGAAETKKQVSFGQ